MTETLKAKLAELDAKVAAEKEATGEVSLETALAWWDTATAIPTEDRPLFVPCEVCGTEGRIYSGSYEDERDEGECYACHGTCAMEVPSESVALEDITNG